MSSFTLSRPQAFPEGTSVSVYPESNWPGKLDQSAAPVGTATDTQTVTNGAVTFSGLAEGIHYWAYGNGRYVNFTIGQSASGKADEADLEAVAFDVKLFGAKGDGVTDDTAAISAAMDAANSAGASLFFSPGTYVSGVITKSYAPLIWAHPGTATIKASNTSSWMWNFVGTKGSNISLTGNAAEGDWQIALNTSTFAVGDFILIGDQQTPYAFESTRYQGQTTQVHTIDSASAMSLIDSVYAPLLTASSAFAAKITGPTGVKIKGLRFLNTNPLMLGGFIRVRYARDIDIDVDGEGSGHGGIRLEHCSNFRVRTSAKDYYDKSLTGLEQYGYGFEAAGACSHGEVNVKAQRVRHAFTAGAIDNENGEAINILVTGVAHGCSSASWDAHAHARHIVFDNCLSYSPRGYNFALRGQDQHIRGGLAKGGFGGVWVFNHPGKISIDGLHIRDIAATSALDSSAVGGQGILVQEPCIEFTIRDCLIENIAGNAIGFKGGVQSDGVITNNTFRNFGQALTSGEKNAFRVYTGLERTRITHNTVEDNQGVVTALNAFVYDAGISDVTEERNTIRNGIIKRAGAAAGSVSQSTYLDRIKFWVPSAAIDSTFSRDESSASGAVLVSGRLSLAGGLVIPAGQTVSKITFFSGGTAAVSPTNQWFCLVAQDATTIIAKTADDTTTAWAANSAKQLTLSSSYTPATDTPVYAGIMVAAGTVPTIIESGISTVIGGRSPMMAATAATGLTTPASFTAVGSLTALSLLPYAEIA